MQEHFHFEKTVDSVDYLNILGYFYMYAHKSCREAKCS